VANPAKEQKVGELREVFMQTRSAVLADFRGLTVQQMNELRGLVRRESAGLLVVKNRLARLAARESQFEALVEDFRGPTSITYSYESDVAPARVATGFAKDQDAFEITAGMLEGKRLAPEQVKNLADLPPREVLLGRLMADLSRPQGELVRVLSGILQRFLYLMEAMRRAKETA
jgi:large subunit ribosomal protein L10